MLTDASGALVKDIKKENYIVFIALKLCIQSIKGKKKIHLLVSLISVPEISVSRTRICLSKLLNKSLSFLFFLKKSYLFSN